MPHPGRMTTQKAKDFKGTMRSLLAELGHYKFRLIAVIVFVIGIFVLRKCSLLQ